MPPKFVNMFHKEQPIQNAESETVYNAFNSHQNGLRGSSMIFGSAASFIVFFWSAPGIIPNIYWDLTSKYDTYY